MKRRFVRHISRALIFVYMFASATVHGASADLASVPLVTSSTSAVLPNLMFVLDDSGSMDWAYMPDWANSNNDALFRNNDYNGVYYTAAVTYTPPVYYDSTGALDTTTYPSQTSANTSAWVKVKNDGYCVQSTCSTTSDLTGSAFFYTFIPGEYCSDVKLRNCVNQSAPSVANPYPAKVRWCTTSALTTCQAVRIEEGTTLYTNVRTAGGAGNTATVTIASASSLVINGITVGGSQILSAATASSGTNNTVAGNIVTAINNCTAARTGACDVAGYSASRSGATVTITAPSSGSVVSGTPSVSTNVGATKGAAGTATATAFVAGIAGQNLRTDIVSGTNSYPYPGTSAKASTRSDCAGTTCTYAEEMTNYANWWAYYHTRMQMMKTASSLAFKDIGIKYRIGFDTINGNTSGFLNISTFDATQKKAWYDKFFAANPSNSTPLRTALSAIGRLYAGKLNGTSYHGATVVDPIQYSCQQNFTILSTDGYWNGGSGAKIDGTAFGTLNPDGAEIRPMNDGATAVITTATPTVTTVTSETTQNVSVSTPWTRTITTVGAACTTPSSGASTPTSCVQDNGNWRSNSPAASDVRTWCMEPNSNNGSDCSQISGLAGIWACRGSGSPTNLPGGNDTACVGTAPNQYCIYKGNSVGSSCVEIPGYGPSNLAVSSRMYACKPPVTGGVAGNQLTTTNQAYTQVQTGVVTTRQAVATTSTSSVTTTNGVSAPAIVTTSTTTSTVAGYPQTVMAADNPGINTDDPPTGSPPWATVSTTTACTAGAVAGTGAATSGTVVNANVGSASTPTTILTVGPTQGTPVVTSSSTGGNLDTLADVAEYYYATDLRDSTLSNCTGVPIPPAASGLDVCGSTTTADLLQRMVTFTLGLGASGQMQYSSTYSNATSGDYFDVKNGTAANGSSICVWQSSGSCNWPAPASDSQMNIDDLWHAAVNGRGQYFSATSPASLSSGLSSALAGVNAQLGSSAAATTSNPNVTSGDNFVFSTTFETVNWDGELVRNQLDLVTGVVSSVNDWTAQAQLETNASRTIYMFDAAQTSKLAAFNWANVSADATKTTYFQKPAIAGLTQFCAAGATCLAAADQTLAEGQNLVQYIRGVRTNEGISTDVTKYYRLRTHVLGDIVNAEAVYVKTPLENYADTDFSAYVSAQASRQGMVYAAGNDGMLHAFNASTGAESWAYIPTMVMPNLYKLADKNYKALHQFYVDGTPVAGEIYTGTGWKTIVVGGLNNGGRGYYALDVTDPAAPKALWEFTDASLVPNATNGYLGYTYGNPIITKLYDGHGTGTWVVLVATGYNNVSPGDGVGRLLVINAATGVLIRSISTGVGSTTTPSGLSKINAWVDTGSTDNTTLRVYGGDLLGNLWRFDINNLYGTAGYDAQRLVTAYADAAGTIPQSFTARPELGEVSGKAVILAGTGRFLGATDLSDTTTQSFYAVKDKLDATSYSNPKAIGSGFIRQQMSETTCPAGTPTSVCTSGQTVRVSINEQAVNFATDSGWYLDLIGSGERANVDPTLALGTLGFNTNLPNTSACTAGGTSFRYFLDYTKGTPVSTARASGSGVGVIGVSFGNSLATRGVFVRLPNNTVVQLTRLSTGATITSNVPIGSGSASTRRVSWRELISE